MVVIDKVLGTVKQAIEIEKFGYEFLNGMRSMVEDRQGQKLICYLAQLEVDHIKWLEEEYERQLEKLEEFKEEPSVDISVVGKGEIFLDIEKISEIFSDFDPVRAVNFAIELEKRSVDFYERHMEVSDDDGTKRLFKKLADFEKDHIDVLNVTLNSLENTGAWKAP